MMHGRENSDLVIVAVKPANKAEQPAAERSAVEANRSGSSGAKGQGRGPRGMRTSKARTGLRARLACQRRRTAYGKRLPSHTRGGSRMRESRTYGSVRGARGNSRPYRVSTRHTRCCTCSRPVLASGGPLRRDNLVANRAKRT